MTCPATRRWTYRDAAAEQVAYEHNGVAVDERGPPGLTGVCNAARVSPKAWETQWTSCWRNRDWSARNGVHVGRRGVIIESTIRTSKPRSSVPRATIYRRPVRPPAPLPVVEPLSQRTTLNWQNFGVCSRRGLNETDGRRFDEGSSAGSQKA